MGKVKTVLTENGVADAVTKQKAKKNKKKETGDSEAKQKKTNPYLLFSKDKRIEFKNSGKLETLENADVMKEIGKLWKTLDEAAKNIWKEKARKLDESMQQEANIVAEA